MIIKNYIGNIVKALKNEPFNVFAKEAEKAKLRSKLRTLNFGKKNRETLINEGFINNQDVFSVIFKLAKLTSGLVESAVELKNNNDVVKWEDNDELMSFLWDKWQDNESFQDAIYKEIVYLLLTGDSFHYLPYSFSGAKLPDKNYILPAHLVIPYRDKQSSLLQDITHYDFYDVSRVMRLLPEEIAHSKFFDPTTEGIMQGLGMSALQAGYRSLTSSNERTEAEAHIFANRGVTGIISTKGEYPLTAEDKEIIDNELTSRLGGAKKFNRFISLNGNVDVKELGMTPEDLKIIEARLEHLRVICNLYGVPSVLFGDTSNSSYNNMKEANKALYKDVVIPLLQLILEKKNKTLINRYNRVTGEKYILKIDTQKIEALQPEPKELIESVVKLYEKGLLDWNESREMLSKPLENMDDETIKATLRINPAIWNNLTEEEKSKIINNG